MKTTIPNIALASLLCVAPHILFFAVMVHAAIKSASIFVYIAAALTLASSILACVFVAVVVRDDVSI